MHGDRHVTHTIIKKFEKYHLKRKKKIRRNGLQSAPHKLTCDMSLSYRGVDGRDSLRFLSQPRLLSVTLTFPSHGEMKPTRFSLTQRLKLKTVKSSILPDPNRVTNHPQNQEIKLSDSQNPKIFVKVQLI